jgi:hypothetical protein
MAKLSDMKGQELVDVKEQNDELILIFKNNTYVLRLKEGKLAFESP